MVDKKRKMNVVICTVTNAVESEWCVCSWVRGVKERMVCVCVSVI